MFWQAAAVASGQLGRACRWPGGGPEAAAPGSAEPAQPARQRGSRPPRPAHQCAVPEDATAYWVAARPSRPSTVSAGLGVWRAAAAARRELHALWRHLSPAAQPPPLARWCRSDSAPAGSWLPLRQQPAAARPPGSAMPGCCRARCMPAAGLAASSRVCARGRPGRLALGRTLAVFPLSPPPSCSSRSPVAPPPLFVCPPFALYPAPALDCPAHLQHSHPAGGSCGGRRRAGGRSGLARRAAACVGIQGAACLDCQRQPDAVCAGPGRRIAEWEGRACTAVTQAPPAIDFGDPQPRPGVIGCSPCHSSSPPCRP